MAYESALPQGVEEYVLHLADLPANWDSYGARRVAPRAISRTLEVLRSIYPRLPRPSSEPFVAPDADGGLGIELALASGGELLISVDAQGTTTYLLAAAEEERSGLLESEADIQELARGCLAR